jgi:hypothetical protein
MEVMHDLGPDCDVSSVVRFAQAHQEALLDELGAHPGLDQVRAAAARLLPFLVPEAEAWSSWLEPAWEALGRYEQDVRDHGAALFFRRHPAWVGLATVEIGLLKGMSEADAIDEGVRLSALGFAEIAEAETSRGEVLWAMAEQAEDVSWTTRSRSLLMASGAAVFAREANRQQVLFLIAMRALENGDGDLSDIEAVATHPESPNQTRVHASWVAGQLHMEAGSYEKAEGALKGALELVDAEVEPDIARRIGEALASLSERSL